MGEVEGTEGVYGLARRSRFLQLLDQRRQECGHQCLSLPALEGAFQPELSPRDQGHHTRHDEGRHQPESEAEGEAQKRCRVRAGAAARGWFRTASGRGSRPNLVGQRESPFGQAGEAAI